MALSITIDNGGTFTDVCVTDGNRVIHKKTLTTPYDLSECFVNVLKDAAKELYSSDNLASLFADTEWMRYSSTVGTNAVVQRKGPRIGLLLSSGIDFQRLFVNEEEKDLWHVFVDDRVDSVTLTDNTAQAEEDTVQAVNRLLSKGANRLVVSLSGPDRAAAESLLKMILLRKYPRHMLGAVPVLFSHELSDDPDDRRRTWSALLNSFLHPEVEGFFYNAENILRRHRTRKPLLIFHNDGNSARVAKTIALKTYSSGPRGGLEGARALARYYGWPTVVTMDVGGTTTDIGLIQEGQVFEQARGSVEGVPIAFPLTNTTSIGVGGSSVFSVRDGRVKVGPESMGAAPGPAAFGRGGENATITDAYLQMGIFSADSFFGGTMSLDAARAEAAIMQNVAAPLGIDLPEALIRMQEAFEKTMALAIPTLEDKNRTVLLAFGGAGPMSACGVADAVGIKTVVVPRLAAVFSAFGISFSDIAHEYTSTVTHQIDRIDQELEVLRQRAARDMFAEGFGMDQCVLEEMVRVVDGNGRYRQSLTVEQAKNSAAVENGDEMLLLVRVIKPLQHFALKDTRDLQAFPATPSSTRRVIVSPLEVRDILVYRLENLGPGAQGEGPALIEDAYFTCRVKDGWSFSVNENQDLVLMHHER